MLEKEGKPVDSFNATGDKQQKLDLLAHDFFVKALDSTQEVCAVISEEADSLVPLTHSQAPYIVAMDPLDGSANVPINGPIGTLFSIYPRRMAPEVPLQEADVLMLGNQQVAAGYILYSTVVVLVYATPHRVHGFVYDPELNDFVLARPNIYMPESGLTYAINHSYLSNFPHYIQHYITYCRRQELSCRYTGALVADFHRHLLEGGIYLYPPTLKRPSGKLRLIFECNVLAYIAEQAGGMASDGKQSILQIMPRSLHQCVPFYIGSKGMIQPLLALASQ
jgi:fructose-1,6-bisphosphatase I